MEIQNQITYHTWRLMESWVNEYLNLNFLVLINSQTTCTGTVIYKWYAIWRFYFVCIVVAKGIKERRSNWVVAAAEYECTEQWWELSTRRKVQEQSDELPPVQTQAQSKQRDEAVSDQMLVPSADESWADEVDGEMEKLEESAIEAAAEAEQESCAITKMPTRCTIRQYAHGLKLKSPFVPSSTHCWAVQVRKAKTAVSMAVEAKPEVEIWRRPKKIERALVTSYRPSVVTFPLS